MAKCFYLKGLSTTTSELEAIKSKFSKSGIELIPLVDNYADIYNINEQEFIEKMKEKLKEEQDINLVCHSMGCNFGLLLASNIPNIKTLTLVSPEFVQTSKEEKQNIKNNKSTKNDEKIQIGPKMNLVDKLKSLKLFTKSIEWINNYLLTFFKNNTIPTKIVYSKGDIFVSQKFIHKLENIDCYEANSNNHNPLLTDDTCITKINEFILEQNNSIKKY